MFTCDQLEFIFEKLVRSSGAGKNRRKNTLKKKISMGIIKFLKPTFNVLETAGNKLMSS